VLFCDLDGFKAVNDRYGHDAGDELLRASADRLRSCLRAGDVLARLGGDEFAVLLPEVTRDADALQVAAAIHDAVANRFLLTGGEAQIGVSIGVAFSAATTSGADVLRNADTAMYRAKALGKGRTEQFEPLMRVDLLNRLELEEQLFAPDTWTGSHGGRLGLAARCERPEDVDALHDLLVPLGQGSHLAPFDAFWGQRYASVLDPDSSPVDLYAASPGAPVLQVPPG